MNCDQVFDRLTRGPFLTGDVAEGDVEAHLRGCHECRMLAEALRPAVDLFHEAMTTQEGQTLPRYHGRLAPCGTHTTTNVMRQIQDAQFESPAAPQSSPRTSTRRLGASTYPLALLAICACVMVMGLGIGPTVVPQLPSEQNGNTVPSEADAQPCRTWRALLESCSDSRFLPREGFTVEIQGTKVICCTQCHAAAARMTTRAEATAIVARACQVCHVERQKAANEGRANQRRTQRI